LPLTLLYACWQVERERKATEAQAEVDRENALKQERKAQEAKEAALSISELRKSMIFRALELPSPRQAGRAHMAGFPAGWLDALHAQPACLPACLQQPVQALPL
jgi:hypothetical protein